MSTSPLNVSSDGSFYAIYFKLETATVLGCFNFKLDSLSLCDSTSLKVSICV